MRHHPVIEPSANRARPAGSATPTGRATAQLLLFAAAMSAVSVVSATLGLVIRLVPARAEPPRR